MNKHKLIGTLAGFCIITTAGLSYYLTQRNKIVGERVIEEDRKFNHDTYRIEMLQKNGYKTTIHTGNKKPQIKEFEYIPLERGLEKSVDSNKLRV